MVPCDPVNYLNTEYGRESWKVPKSKLNEDFIKNPKRKKQEDKSSYKWPNLIFYKQTEDEKFLRSVKWYLSNGNIDEHTTFDYLNRGLTKKLSNHQLKEAVYKN